MMLLKKNIYIRVEDLYLKIKYPRTEISIKGQHT